MMTFFTKKSGVAMVPPADGPAAELKGRLHTPKTTAKMPTRDGARARRGAIDAAERAQAAALADEGCWNAPSQCQSHDDGHGDGSGESVPESTGESKEHVKLEDDGCGTMRQSAEKLENDVCGSKQAAGAGEDESHLSEYEKLRQANIKRNNALLESLDIPSNPIPGATVERQSTGRKNAKKRKPLLALAEFQEPRRSGRRLALADQQREEPLLALPDSWDEAEERPAAAAKRKASIQEIEDRDWDLLEPPPSMHDALEQIGLAQADAVRCLAVSDWKQFAIDKWGPLVARAKVSDWQVYVTSRCSVLPGASGSDMLQERFCGDVWQLLVSCLLMTRVSSADTKDKALAGFFATYPTPSSFKVSEDEDVFEIIKPLGLFDTRIRGLREVTERFLSMPRFIIGLDKEIKPYGCGQFVYESYLIFCCGRGASIQATDKNLRAYCAWLRRELGRRGTVDALDIEA